MCIWTLFFMRKCWVQVTTSAVPQLWGGRNIMRNNYSVSSKSDFCRWTLNSPPLVFVILITGAVWPPPSRHLQHGHSGVVSSLGHFRKKRSALVEVAQMTNGSHLLPQMDFVYDLHISYTKKNYIHYLFFVNFVRPRLQPCSTIRVVPSPVGTFGIGDVLTVDDLKLAELSA